MKLYRYNRISYDTNHNKRRRPVTPAKPKKLLKSINGFSIAKTPGKKKQGIDGALEDIAAYRVTHYDSVDDFQCFRHMRFSAERCYKESNRADEQIFANKIEMNFAISQYLYIFTKNLSLR